MLVLETSSIRQRSGIQWRVGNRRRELAAAWCAALARVRGRGTSSPWVRCGQPWEGIGGSRKPAGADACLRGHESAREQACEQNLAHDRPPESLAAAPKRKPDNSV